MKTTIDVLKRGGVVLGAFLCATMGLSAFGAVDITDFIRCSGSGNYTVMCANGTESNSGVTQAFDGVTSGGDGTSGGLPDTRVLLRHRETVNGSTTVSVTPGGLLYYINDGAMTGFDFKLTSFTLYRIMSGWGALERSATQFNLQGYDGANWHLLFQTDEAQTWDEDTLSRTYEIPVENQACYRTYLFTITANGGDANWSGFHELVFWGDVERRRLVWNGAEGAKWNATDANWLDRAGTVTNWIPDAKAVFGESGTASIAVEGTNDVGGIVFSQTNACMISGGALAMTHGFGITAGCDDVLASELVDAKQVDVYQGLVNGQKNWFPANPDNTKQGTWTLLWRNRRLAGITNFTGAVIQQNATTPRDAAPYHYVNNGDWASVQFQCYPSGSALFCCKVLFAQIGADVYGRVAYINFTWASGRALGDDFDGTIASRTVVKLYDGNVVNDFGNAEAEGFYGIVPHGGEWEVEPVRVVAGLDSCGPAPSNGAYLPRSVSDQNTGDAILCFPGRKVENLVSVASANLFYGTEFKPESMHYFTNNVTNATVQVQGNTNKADGDGARLCVKVNFTDGVGGVYARAVYARYDWNNKYAHNFDASYQGFQPIYAGGSANSGYGVKNLVAVFKGDRLTFGASALTLDHEITSDCTLRFAPLSGSQTVTVPVSRTLDKVAFGGTTTFTFDPGASLSVDTAEVEDSALVNVSGENLLRIGTSKCLAPAARAHFSVNGNDASQDRNGWIVLKPGIVISIR